MMALSSRWVSSLASMRALTAATLTMYGGSAVLLVLGLLTWTPGKNPRWVIATLAAIAVAFFVHTCLRGNRFTKPEATAMVVVQFATIGSLTWTTDLTLAAYSNGSVLPIVCVYVVWFLNPVSGRVLLYAGVLWWFVAIVHHGSSHLTTTSVTLVVQCVLATEVFSRIKSRMDSLVRTDTLTGSLNRRGITEVIEQQMVRCARRGDSLAVVSVDLDGLREVNNTQGHRAGDVLLSSVVRHWRQEIRRHDTIGRLGGDEFLLVLPRSNLEEAHVLVRRLAEESPAHWSAGIAVMKPHDTVVSLVERADQRMYVDKAERQRTV